MFCKTPRFQVQFQSKGKVTQHLVIFSYFFCLKGQHTHFILGFQTNNMGIYLRKNLRNTFAINALNRR